MAYHANTGLVLLALGYQRHDFACGNNGHGLELVWKHSDPPPTAETIAQYAADVTPLPSGEKFSAWWAKRSDPIQARRAEAKQLLATSNEPLIVAVRAAFKAVGASLREVRQAQGKPSRNDEQFLADVLAAIDAGAGEV